MCSWFPAYCHRCLIRKMFVVLLVLACLTAISSADHHHHHQPCHSPNMTGLMNVITTKGETRAVGAFTYDSVGEKLRFTSNESHPTDSSRGLDLLMFFKEDIFYEIDGKTQSCTKNKLHISWHPLDIPNDAKFYTAMTMGSSSVEDERLKINVWGGDLPNTKASYWTSATMGCLPVSTFYFTDTTSFLFGLTDIEPEVKDPDLLTLPSFCHGKSVEDTPEGTVNSFVNEFM
uniref:Ependymin-1-like n=2 Tax=Cyprinodon variegatus TaxID=28743 RepID=A0A3Q2G5J9_CYPVA